MGVLGGRDSGLKILHGGVGGDVEQGARTSKHILVFAFDPISLNSLSFNCAKHHSYHHIILACVEHCFILPYPLYACVCTSLILNHKSFTQHLNPYLGESRGVNPEPFTGNSATFVCCIKCITN